jgi:hypothetical protein
MAETISVTLEDALSDDKFEKLAPKLAALPTSSEFKELVEDSLWKELGGGSEEDSLEYNRVPEESKSIIGWNEEEESVPWWLEDFEWVARIGSKEAGEQIKLDSVDALKTFEQNYDPERTLIDKPKLTTTSILGGFDKLKKELHTKFEDRDFTGETEFDREMFVFHDGRVETSTSFRDWFYEDLLPLCPPFNETLTALFMSNVNITVETLREVYDEEFQNRLQEIGLYTDDTDETERVYNKGYYKGLKNILTYQRDRIFDCRLGNPEFESLGPLEEEFYKSQYEQLDGSSEMTWLQEVSKNDPSQLEAGEERLFANVAFQYPVSLEYHESKFDSPKPKYITGGINKTIRGDSSGYGKSPQKLDEINELLGLSG